MEKLTIMDTNIGKVETNLSVEEAYLEVITARKEGRLGRFPSIRGTATVNIDGTHTQVFNDRVRFLDLSEVKVFGYDDNTYSPMPDIKKKSK